MNGLGDFFVAENTFRNDIIRTMQSTAKDVNAYIQEALVNRQEVLTRLRDLCRATLKGFEESMTYGGHAIHVRAKWK